MDREEQTQRLRVFPLTLFSILFLFCSFTASSAEVWLRESLIKKHGDDILVKIEAAPDHVAKKAQNIAQGCDLNVPLRTDDIKVPVVAKLKNACSYPKGIDGTYWHEKLKPLEGKKVATEGVLRVWLENPPESRKRQCECFRVSPYENSNPSHIVQLHPLTRLGNMSFLNHVSDVIRGKTPYFGKFGKFLPGTLGRRKVFLRRFKVEGENYIAIDGPKTDLGHWTLAATVLSIAQERNGGRAFDVAVKSKGELLKQNLRVLTISGTRAGRIARRLKVNQDIILFGVMRMDLAEVQRAAGLTWKSIPIPYELIGLHITP